MRVMLLLILAFLILPLAGGYTLTQYSADYEIIGTKALVRETLDYDLPVEGLEWALPPDASQVSVDGLPFEIDELPSYTEIRILANTSQAQISYITGSVIESSGDNYFILDLSRSKGARRSVFLMLPEDAKLKYPLTSGQPSIVPKTSDIATDGRRLIIRWSDSDFTRSEAILVIYQMPRQYWPALLAATAVFAMLAAIVGYKFAARKTLSSESAISSASQGAHKHPHEPESERIKHELTRNLFEDEKLIVEALLKEEKHELWQKQLELRTKLPKVRLSRKLRSLEAKGLIEKVPYGNTNHIRLKTP